MLEAAAYDVEYAGKAPCKGRAQHIPLPGRARGRSDPGTPERDNPVSSDPSQSQATDPILESRSDAVISVQEDGNMPRRMWSLVDGL